MWWKDLQNDFISSFSPTFIDFWMTKSRLDYLLWQVERLWYIKRQALPAIFTHAVRLKFSLSYWLHHAAIPSFQLFQTSSAYNSRTNDHPKRVALLRPESALRNKKLFQEVAAAVQHVQHFLTSFHPFTLLLLSCASLGRHLTYGISDWEGQRHKALTKCKLKMSHFLTSWRDVSLIKQTVKCEL